MTSDVHMNGNGFDREDSNKPELAIEVRNLSYAFSTSDGRKKPVLHDINLRVKHGSRLLIIGPNGAGKSTLLRLIAGKHLTGDRDSVQVLGKPAFFQTLGVSGVSFLGNSMWSRPVAFVGSSVTYEADIAAGDLMADLQTEFRERRDKLVHLLDIDLEWRLNAVSDGQRRRIQIMLGLLQPFKVLLIDEFTVDLDVLARKDLLDYLRRETEERDCTIVYCTHIFDGMDDWPTHSLFMADGRICKVLETPLKQPLYRLCLEFMLEARESQHKAKKQREEPLVEDFGVQGFSAGRMFPTTDFFSRNRMNDYKF